MALKVLLALAATALCGCATLNLVTGNSRNSTTRFEAPSAEAPQTLDISKVTRDRALGDRPPFLQKGDTARISLTGAVRTPHGESIAGARVYLLSEYGDNSHGGSDEPLAIAETDSEGRYEFRDVPLPTRLTGAFIDSEEHLQRYLQGTFQICGEAHGFGVGWLPKCAYAPRSRPKVLPAEAATGQYFLGENVEQDLLLSPVRPLNGRILNDQGRPVKDAKLHLQSLDYLNTEGRAPWRKERAFNELSLLPERFHLARSDHEGRFEFSCIPNDTVVSMTVEHEDFAELSLEVAITDIPVTENRYVDGTRPEFGDTPNGAALVWKTRKVQTSPVEVRCRTARRVVVSVLHSDGTPAAGVGVGTLGEAWGYPADASAGGYSNEHGEVVLKLPPGRYGLSAMPDKATDELLTFRELIVTDQPDDQNIEYRLERGCKLTLEAVDASTGKGIPGVSFFSVPKWTGGPETDNTGASHLLVEPGVRQFAVRTAEGYEFDFPGPAAMRDVKCEAGRTAHLQFRLKKKTAVSKFLTE